MSNKKMKIIHRYTKEARESGLAVNERNIKRIYKQTPRTRKELETQTLEQETRHMNIKRRMNKATKEINNERSSTEGTKETATLQTPEGSAD